MLGASQEKYRSHNFKATKYDMIDTSLGVLNGAIGDASASGSSAEWAMRFFLRSCQLGLATEVFAGNQFESRPIFPLPQIQTYRILSFRIFCMAFRTGNSWKD